MNFTVLQTKLFIPSTRSLLVRPHLIQILDESRRAEHRLILISSSAGSGKTSLLGEWAAQHPGEWAWLSLDSADNEPTRFWSYLIAALQRIQAGMGQEAAGLLVSPQPVPVQTILVTLLNEFANHPSPFILALDDYHVISNLEIHSGMAFLLEHLPPQVSLVISTRADPPLPIVRLRAHAQLTEIREAQLRFSAEEAASFLETMGLNLSTQDVFAIETRTEGWIAGLQLVGLALRAQPAMISDPHPFISAFTGSRQHILDYLAEEVLSHLEKEVQDFLVKTSILERMCAELCAEVVGDPGEPKPAPHRPTLNELERANLFTLPLDAERHWFRYHHLFADLLANRLQETLPASEIQQLHCRASQWLARNHLVDDAIRHALLGQDFERAAALIESLAQAMMFSGRVNTLKNWIGALPETCLQSHPRLKIYAVWIELMQGICELTQQKVQETEQLIRSLPASPENNQLKVELMVILCRFIAISGDTTQAIRVVQETHDLIAESDLGSRARVQSALAIAYGLDGDFEKSMTAFHECLRLARDCGYYSLMAHTTMLMSMGHAHYGKLREPARYLQEVIDLGTQSGQKTFFPAGQGYIGLASIYLEWNDLDRAEKMLQQGIDLCSQAGLDGVFNGLILKARLRQARGDLKGALEEIQAVEKSFQRKDHDTAARQVQILLAMGAIDVAAHWVLPITAILNVESAAPKIPFLFMEVLKIILARIFLARGEFAKALQCLDEFHLQPETGRRIGHLIEVYTLKALAFQKQNQGKITPPALESLERALELAEPEGYTLFFLEMGMEIVPLLNAVSHLPTVTDRLKNYAVKLLAAFPVGKSLLAPSAPATLPPSEETLDLSQREIEILGLIAQGCSNQEIAARLFITLHTVKKHGSHIFAKLGVTSRTQAVAKARQAGLL
jgi:LuxR family maltose regulon positive regulatory protein